MARLSYLFNLFDKASSTLVLLGAEVFPLCLNLAVFFQLGIAFGIFVVQFLIGGDKVGKEQCVYALALVFGFHGYDK